MEVQDISGKGPFLLQCKIVFRVWSNRTNKHDKHLIAPEFLSEIEATLEMARKLMVECTLPGFPEDWRYVEPLQPRFRRFVQIRNELEVALDALVRRWPEVLSEAKIRLGEKFSEEDYPNPRSLFGIDLGLLAASDISTILEKYSLSFREPQEPDIFDAKEWVKQLNEEKKKPPNKRKIPPWPPRSRQR